jgi:hypothetical protein
MEFGGRVRSCAARFLETLCGAAARASLRYAEGAALPEASSREFWEGASFAERFFMGLDEATAIDA